MTEKFVKDDNVCVPMLDIIYYFTNAKTDLEPYLRAEADV
jgi:hypothetical protein